MGGESLRTSGWNGAALADSLVMVSSLPGAGGSEEGAEPADGEGDGAEEEVASSRPSPATGPSSSFSSCPGEGEGSSTCSLGTSSRPLSCSPTSAVSASSGTGRPTCPVARRARAFLTSLSTATPASAASALPPAGASVPALVEVQETGAGVAEGCAACSMELSTGGALRVPGLPAVGSAASAWHGSAPASEE